MNEYGRPPQDSNRLPTWAKVLLVAGGVLLVIVVLAPIVLIGLIGFACSSH